MENRTETEKDIENNNKNEDKNVYKSENNNVYENVYKNVYKNVDNNENKKGKIYLAIDLKSFYASVECVERGLEPLDTNLVVADKSRTEKTICLAVSPALKSYGIPGRPRLFEVVAGVKQVNAARKAKNNIKEFKGESHFKSELDKDGNLGVDYIVAPPRMALYMDYSKKIYNIYLKYVSPEDVHIYSVDEVFIDLTPYLGTYKKTPEKMAEMMIKDVYETTGITATAGIGTNMYLAKVAMDIVAKHMKADENGVRMASLDEMKYREKLWDHVPLTDFWRLGRGYAKKLNKKGMYTMGDVARCSIGSKNDYYNKELLYKMFGINAELLIDHAWGYEPCEIKDIKAYKPDSNSISQGQVLKEPYNFTDGELIVKEMTELVSLDLVKKSLKTNKMVLHVGYDVENILDDNIEYNGEIVMDRYKRLIPKPAHGTVNLDKYTSSSSVMREKIVELYRTIVDPKLLIRRFNVSCYV